MRNTRQTNNMISFWLRISLHCGEKYKPNFTNENNRRRFACRGFYVPTAKFSDLSHVIDIQYNETDCHQESTISTKSSINLTALTSIILSLLHCLCSLSNRMAPIIHLVRHAEGHHNVEENGEKIRDPFLTEKGKQQCQQLCDELPHHDQVLIDG